MKPTHASVAGSSAGGSRATWTPVLDTLVERAGVARRNARWRECNSLSALGLLHAGRLGFPIKSVEFLKLLGAVAFERGDMRTAERHFEDALGVARRHGNARYQADALVNLGAIANVRGRFHEALRHYRSGRRASRQAGNPRAEARALNNLGMVFSDLGRWRAASHCFRQARELAIVQHDDALVGVIALNATEVFLEAGRLEEARESCDEAVERLIAAGDPLGTAEAYRFYGQIYLRSGKVALAESHFVRAARRSRELGAPLTEAEALRELGHLHLGQGKHRSALEAFARSLKLFRTVEADRDLADMREKIDDLESIIVRIVQELGREVESRDRYLYGHSSRVAEYAVAIACDLDFTPDEMKGILVAGYLHDVGKLQIDPAILNKEGRLTADEMAAVRQHPVLGVEHLTRFELPWDVEETIRGHHERYDGTGYPDGLAGEAIPLGARILLVADVFDALTTARPYRAPWTREQALTYLEMSAGRLADPRVIDVFVRVAQREAYGPERVEAALAEDAAVMTPDELAATFAALPAPSEWDRLDEEFARS
jgi:putative nucleotidyltransferase with HDIG domain